ncbi:hypothetical protein Tsubulata_030402 [Turnera subulata]|uniref:DOG1 domain-containing protein n=1 Tax=Turnera subulata TaxID=218843 RepID=A0A9Q0GIQ4_9ROSI|nr:hypothetical protein Tsubulata_030402 [Turnera subulata]
MASVSETFGNFYNSWLTRQQALLDQLLLAIAPESEGSSNDDRQKQVIDQVLAHYKDYYEEKAKAASEDVLTFLYPPWLTPFERTLLWLGDFKPSFIFRLLAVSVEDLTEEQRGRIEQVRVETRVMERELTDAMARVQESVAAPAFLSLARRFDRHIIDGELPNMVEVVEGLKNTMLQVMERADGLRVSTVGSVVEVLTPGQTLVLLAAAGQFQARIRRWGSQRDAQSSATAT